MVGKFKLEEVIRSPMEDDISALTEAGAYLFRVYCPVGYTEENPFACAVSKQGKLYLHAPGSRVERYPSEKNISAEVNLEGALKMFVGAESASGTSIKLTALGGIEADIGRNNTGQAIKVKFHCSTVTSYDGVADNDDVMKSEDINGNCEKSVKGQDVTTVYGTSTLLCNGQIVQNADRININAHSGMTVNSGEYNSTVMGKSQYNYALAILETIVAGGRITTVLAGGLVTNILAGVYTVSAAAGAISIIAGAGAATYYAGGAMVHSAGGALSQVAGGAISATAGLAISLTAGLAATITSPLAVNLVAPQILLGGPPAVLGVARGTPMMPPGTPSLDWICGLPLMGAAMSRSI